MDCQITFAKNIKIYRQFLGLSQEALANQCGLDTSYIGRIERQVVSPTVKTIQKISDALNINASILFSDALNKEFNDYAVVKFKDGDFSVVRIDEKDLDSKSRKVLDMLFEC